MITYNYEFPCSRALCLDLRIRTTYKLICKVYKTISSFNYLLSFINQLSFILGYNFISKCYKKFYNSFLRPKMVYKFSLNFVIGRKLNILKLQHLKGLSIKLGEFFSSKKNIYPSSSNRVCPSCSNTCF